MERASRRHGRGRKPHPDVLTPAEWRVLEEVRGGLTNAEIAERLGLSLNTVKTHVSSMLARLGLYDRRALAEWRGEPSSATRRALVRLRFAAPLGWLGGRGGTVAAAARAVAGAGLPAPTTTPAVERTPTPAPTPASTPSPPYRRTFAPGETIDVSSAVIFVDTETGDAEAWVIPGAMPEFGVAPSGTYIVYRAGPDGPVRLLRTDDGSDRAIDADSLPIEYGPGDSGFIATRDAGFIVSAYDGHGESMGDLWLGGVTARTAASWSPDGEAIASAIYPGGGRALTLTIRSATGAGRAELNVGASEGGVSVEWSHDSQRLALATEDRVRVFMREGDLLWEYEAQFYGNPRWSPDDAHLYVNAMPDGQADVAYIFTADGEALFRFVLPTFGGGCGGDPWLDAERFQLGEYVVSTRGDVTGPGSEPRSPRPADYGVVLNPVTDSLGYHISHHGDEHVYFTEDGRFVFTTPEVGHGGCGTGVRVSGEPPELQHPPYEPFPTQASVDKETGSGSPPP